MELSERQTLSLAMAGYERSRFKNAVWAAFPCLLFPLIAIAAGGPLSFSVALGAALWGAVVLLAWRGQAWGMSVPAGLKAGVCPLALALIAQRIGHVCTPQGCTSLCVPMCMVGGLLAGLVIWAAAHRSPSPLITLLCGAALSFAVGSMGCSCVGAAGMFGLGVGLTGSTALALAVQKFK